MRLGKINDDLVLEGVATAIVVAIEVLVLVLVLVLVVVVIQRGAAMKMGYMMTP